MESFYLKNSYRKKNKTKQNTFGHKPPLSPKTVLLAWCFQEAPLGHALITAAQKPTETPCCLHTRSHSQLASLPWEPRPPPEMPSFPTPLGGSHPPQEGWINPSGWLPSSRVPNSVGLGWDLEGLRFSGDPSCPHGSWPGAALCKPLRFLLPGCEVGSRLSIDSRLHLALTHWVSPFPMDWFPNI